MKFCKNLQRVVDISDPEWSPYWVNYKMLKKLIKELPSLVHPEDSADGSSPAEQRDQAESNPDSSSAGGSMKQDHGDQTAEGPAGGGGHRQISVGGSDVELVSAPSGQEDASGDGKVPASRAKAMERSPGEVAFFKLLHSELRKANQFFDKAEEEFGIREERVREGMEITKKPNSIMVNDKWSLLAKSLYRLYKDLLLLETYAIMTYCSFSKILKKHDKVTRFDTRSAFMANVVNKANFTTYPKILAMITRCESMYEEVSQHLSREGQEGLCEDERLFINMIHRLNAQVMDTANAEGAPDLGDRKRILKGTPIHVTGKTTPPSPASSSRSAEETRRVASSLRSLVEENEARAAAGNISGEESSNAASKRPAETEAVSTEVAASSQKRTRMV